MKELGHDSGQMQYDIVYVLTDGCISINRTSYINLSVELGDWMNDINGIPDIER